MLGGVALLAEGVDRNIYRRTLCIYLLMSPSSRRAWIEIDDRVIDALFCHVALLTEGVDRNLFKSVLANIARGHLPRRGYG